MTVQLKTWDEIDILIDTDTIALGEYALEVTQELKKIREKYNKLCNQNRARNAGY